MVLVNEEQSKGVENIPTCAIYPLSELAFLIDATVSAIYGVNILA